MVKCPSSVAADDGVVVITVSIAVEAGSVLVDRYSNYSLTTFFSSFNHELYYIIPFACHTYLYLFKLSTLRLIFANFQAVNFRLSTQKDQSFGSIQRFLCSNCKRTFSVNIGFEKMKHNPQAVITAMQLYFSGESL